MADIDNNPPQGHSHRLNQLQAETKAAFSHLFTFNYEGIRKFETGFYGVLYATGTKRIKSILGVERELLILSAAYDDQQPRSVQFARKIVDELDGRLETTICIIVHSDPRGNAKLKRWGREQGIAVIPVFSSTLILPRGQDLERLLSAEFFSQDPFDITGPVASDSQFFGRRTEAQELARKLQKGQIRSCFGIRKIGKTSVMHRVLQEIKENYEGVTVFIDCQRDDVFSLNASGLLLSISRSLEILLKSGQPYVEVNAYPTEQSIADSARVFQDTLQRFDVPVVLAFDEVDYITPGNSAAPHWRQGFLEFWRNIRAGYHAAERANRKVSLLISGVSSRWFTVESIDGIENAALAFVPEEYLSPLPRGASNAMIKNLGSVAGLRFNDEATEYISFYCSDMPFWIRKACSYIHARIETSKRPIVLGREDISHIVNDFGADEGATLASVALQHLFRVYPDLREPAFSFLGNDTTNNEGIRRTLIRYGIITSRGSISGAMVEGALRLERDSEPLAAYIFSDQAGKPEISEWAEELATIGVKRNTLERSMRSIVVNFLRVDALSDKSGKTAKSVLLQSVEPRRKSELERYNIEVMSEKLLWLELTNCVAKNWSLFERVFGDKAAFLHAAKIINDRPDTHAKNLEPSDVALQKRELNWMEDRIARI